MNELRIGGVFFDDMNDRPQEELLAFATDMAGAVVPAYVPLVAKHKDDEYTETEKEWQQRRGRYASLTRVRSRHHAGRTGGRIGPSSCPCPSRRGGSTTCSPRVDQELTRSTRSET